MPHFSERDVIDLGTELEYADGVELAMTEILEGAYDRSSTSDELAAHITDWPSRYHFSRLRRNLFEPFRIAPGTRVLEIGCGMGANLVALAEEGAEVVGVEGSLARARAARVRTSSHANVTVYAGDVAALPALEPFDLVIMVGVLEYSMTDAGGASGPEALLRRAVSLLRPGGSVILAIENQLGLKYLLSFPEDHHGLPWVGLDGYRDDVAPRTWSRSALSRLVAEVGLVDQSWLFPFPDYKLPTFIARQRLLESDHGIDVVRQFVRHPVVDRSGSPMFVCDTNRAFDVLVTAGLGPETANSFLLVASADLGASEVLVNDGEAWLSSGERLGAFQSQRVLTVDDGRYLIAPTSGPTSERPATHTWLSNVGHASQVVHPGRCLEDLVVEAIDRDDLQELRSLLGTYDDVLREGRCDPVIDPVNPFLVGVGRHALAGDHLDCTFKNLVVTDETVHFVDREWVAAGGVDEALVRLRSYVELSHRLVASDIEHRWSPALTVVDLAQTLRSLIGDGWTTDELAAYAHAEGELQRIVSGHAVSHRVEDLLAVRRADHVPAMPVLSLIRRAGSYESARADLLGMREETQRLIASIDEARAAHDRAVAEHHQVSLDYGELAIAYQQFHDSVHERFEQFESEILVLRTERDAMRMSIAQLIEARDSLQAHVDSIRRSRSYRVGSAMTAPMRVFRRH